MNKVWIIDDDRSIRWVLEKALARHGSKALHRLPEVMVQRSLEQLAIMQRSQNLAVLTTLRARLLECTDLCTHTPLPYSISTLKRSR